MKIEIRPIEEIADYFVSRCGKVYSLKSGFLIELRQKKIYSGYHVTSFSNRGFVSTKLVHRCVAKAWIQNPHHKLTVNHKDGDKSNNCDLNLEWATLAENHIHATRILGKRRGSAHANSKLTEAIVRSIRTDLRSCPQLAAEYGVSFGTIAKARSGKTWCHVK